ncbi:hypothetical protein IFR05_008836 [Cadophora sp. M221]|nr:hypothetical protein IFR05_008836 [Cadophora sp. M221]
MARTYAASRTLHMLNVSAALSEDTEAVITRKRKAESKGWSVSHLMRESREGESLRWSVVVRNVEEMRQEEKETDDDDAAQ